MNCKQVTTFLIIAPGNDTTTHTQTGWTQTSVKAATLARRRK